MLKIDPNLIKRCIQQERAAQNQLYKELFSYLMNICMRYKNDYDTAGASLNAIFLKILTNIEVYKQEHSFIAWAKRIAVNHLIDEYRSEKRYSKQTSYLEESTIQDSSEDFHNKEQELEADYLLQIIKQLPETTRKVFNLYSIDGYKHREISEMLQMSENTSKWHLREARLKLQAKLLVYNNSNV